MRDLNQPNFDTQVNKDFSATSATMWRTGIFVLISMVASPAQGAAVYVQACDAPAIASPINSSLTNPDGSDQDVTAFDNFKLTQSGRVTGVTWRGTSADSSTAGFVITIYPPQSNPAAQADLSNSLGVITESGKANEKLVGNGLSDYHAAFSQPVELSAGIQYWISIVSVRNFPSPWGWSSGVGGDGKSIQWFSELRMLPAPHDRAFTLFNDSAEPPK